MTTDARQAPEPRFGVLRTIALYKLVKVLLLLALAYGEVRLRDASLTAKLLDLGVGAAPGIRTPRRHPAAGVVQRPERRRESMRCAS